MASKKKKPSPPPARDLTVVADELARVLDADILLCNEKLQRHLDQRIIELCCSRHRRTNVALFMVTGGGDADVAYRISACLQRKYTKFTFFVPGYCKSAGTLVGLGANEIAIADQGELGPLDVQMSQKDELVSRQSGLTAAAALGTLNQQAFEAFEWFFLEITRKSQGQISSKTASEIATRMACGLFTPIYQQVDPMHVGEAGRALLIAREYGRRLLAKGKNHKMTVENVVEHLIAHYPSHSFIVDLAEARTMFKHARELTPLENELVRVLDPVSRWPLDGDDQFTGFISTARKPRRKSTRPAKGGSDAGQKEPGSADSAGSGARAGTKAGSAAATPATQITAIGRVPKRRP